MHEYDPVVLGSTLIIKMFKTNYGTSPKDLFPNLSVLDAKKAFNFIKNGIDYDENSFDFSSYINYDKIKPYLFNNDAKVMSFKEALHYKFPDAVFIKPGPDLKYFKGMVLEKGITLKQKLSECMCDDDLEEESFNVVYSSVKEPAVAERRFFIIQGRIAGYSAYMRNGVVNPGEFVPVRVLRQAESLACLYQPAKSFVMDLAEDKHGYLSIVEYNCINASGLYKADLGNYCKWSRVRPNFSLYRKKLNE